MKEYFKTTQMVRRYIENKNFAGHSLRSGLNLLVCKNKGIS